MDTSNMNNSVTNINNLGFDAVWSGSAYETQSQQLTDTMSKLNQCISDLNDFDVILTKRDTYIEICNTLSRLYSQRASCQSGHGEEQEKYGCGNCSSLSTQIAEYERKRKELREEIIGLLSKFVGIDAEIFPPADLSIVDDGVVDVFFDLDELNAFSSRGNVPVWEGSIFDLYADEGGIDYINGRIADIVSKCSNEREIAVNVGLLLVDMCKDKGYVLDYKHSGQHSLNYMYGYGTSMISVNGDQYTFSPESGVDPNQVFDKKYNNIYQMSSGGDCCSMVSYLVNVATADDPMSDNPQGFHWEGVNGFKSFGDRIHMSQATAGDVFVYEGHTGMIVRVNTGDDNDPNNGQVYILESGGSYSHLAVNKYDYYTPGDGPDVVMGGRSTMVRDMTKVYSGEQQNHDHLQGYHPEEAYR